MLNLDFWQRQYEVFVSAPVACLAFIALGAIGSWWLRSAIGKAQVAGLNAQIATLNERLTLASEKHGVVEERLEETKIKFNELQQQVKANAPISLTTGLLGQTLASITAIGYANNDLKTSLSPSSAHTITSTSR